MKHQALFSLMGTRWGVEMVLVGYGVGWFVTSLMNLLWVSAVLALAFTVWRYKRLYDRVDVEDLR
jgi:hypothetical protein